MRVRIGREGTPTLAGSRVDDASIAVIWPERHDLPKKSYPTYRKLRDANTRTLAEVRIALRQIMQADGDKPKQVEPNTTKWLRYLTSHNALVLTPVARGPIDLFDDELWGRPSRTAVLERLVVVGPYPSVAFFETLKRKHGAPEILLVVDEGSASTEDLTDHITHIRYASGYKGMVHAKLYVATWRAGRSIRVEQLIWGSANASTNGFERHAETLSSVSMPLSAQAYFQVLRMPEGATTSQLLELEGGLKLALPAFRFKSTPSPETFEGWLQAGFLCHKYDADQTFGRLAIKLKKPLPKGRIEQILADQELKSESKSELMRSAYVSVADDTSDDSANWRTRYFVDSWLGHWTSPECFNDHGELFHAKDKEQRLLAVRTVAKASEELREQWFGQLIARMQKAADGLRTTGEFDPADYFEMEGTAISRTHYEERAFKQMQRHQKQANNEVFETRFATGFEFPSVPPFRGASSTAWSFEDFAVSICDSIVRSWTKGRVQNLLSQAIREVLHDEGVAWNDDTTTGEWLYEHLRSRWSHVGPQIQKFHEPKTKGKKRS